MSIYENMLSGYKERVARIALFDIFNQLENKLTKDNKGKQVDMFGVGLLSLLFFFERRLVRDHHTGIRELAAYLKSALSEQLAFEDEDFFLLSKQVIDIFRPANGKRITKRFYNYEINTEDLIEYSILKADTWDADKKIQYYTLAEQGLELIFATKEYFSEFQISISQLMLRKQLEKGEFQSALRQVEEMRLNVFGIKEKMIDIRREIQRNIMSDDTYERYKEIISDINRRLLQEYDEFEALSTFIRTTKAHYQKLPTLNDVDKNALTVLIRVENELGQVHFMHSSLLNDSIELKTIAIEAASESLYYAGVSAFNFDQEIARKMMSMPLPFTSAKLIGAPFLKLEVFKTWSPLTVFSPQETDDKKATNQTNEFLMLRDKKDNHDLERVQGINEQIFRKIFENVEERSFFTMKELLKNVEKSGNDPIFNTREFFDIWVILHQRSPLSIDSIREHDEHVFSTAFKALFKKDEKTIEVLELPDTIKVSDNYWVCNMSFQIKGEDKHE